MSSGSASATGKSNLPAVGEGFIARDSALKKNPSPAPVATEYFAQKDKERKLQAAKELEEAKSKRKQAIEQSTGITAVEYFAAKDKEEKERKRAEKEAMKLDHPPASVAAEHFKKNELQRLNVSTRTKRMITQKKYMSGRRDSIELHSMEYHTLDGSQKQRKRADIMRKRNEIQALRSSFLKEEGEGFTERTSSGSATTANSNLPAATEHFAKKDQERKLRAAKEEESPLHTEEGFAGEDFGNASGAAGGTIANSGTAQTTSAQIKPAQTTSGASSVGAKAHFSRKSSTLVSPKTRGFGKCWMCSSINVEV